MIDWGSLKISFNYPRLKALKKKTFKKTKIRGYWENSQNCLKIYDLGLLEVCKNFFKKKQDFAPCERCKKFINIYWLRPYDCCEFREKSLKTILKKIQDSWSWGVPRNVFLNCLLDSIGDVKIYIKIQNPTLKRYRRIMGRRTDLKKSLKIPRMSD